MQPHELPQSTVPHAVLLRALVGAASHRVASVLTAAQDVALRAAAAQRAARVLAFAADVARAGVAAVDTRDTARLSAAEHLARDARGACDLRLARVRRRAVERAHLVDAGSRSRAHIGALQRRATLTTAATGAAGPASRSPTARRAAARTSPTGAVRGRARRGRAARRPGPRAALDRSQPFAVEEAAAEAKEESGAPKHGSRVPGQRIRRLSRAPKACTFGPLACSSCPSPARRAASERRRSP
jgi:hypothetical protein